MTRTKLALLVAAASAFALTAQGEAVFLNPVTGAFAAGSSLVLQTHGCHSNCSYGPMMTGRLHRHTRSCILTTRWCRERPRPDRLRWWHRY
jgi:hypothetical protein